jgi:serine/threonine protein kinase
VLSLKFTDKIAEINMEHRGDSLMKFVQTNRFYGTQAFVFAFDLGIQILQALKVLHQAGFVHGDMKPDNICVRELSTLSQHGKSHFQFSLIDFGMISKLKIRKTLVLRKYFAGNIWFSSVEGLK